MEKNQPAEKATYSFFASILRLFLSLGYAGSPNEVRGSQKIGRRDVAQLRDLMTPFGDKPDRRNW